MSFFAPQIIIGFAGNEACLGHMRASNPQPDERPRCCREVDLSSPEGSLHLIGRKKMENESSFNDYVRTSVVLDLIREMTLTSCTALNTPCTAPNLPCTAPNTPCIVPNIYTSGEM